MTKTKSVAGMVAALTLACEWCWSASYYVSENGERGNPGTRAQPFQTIAEGLLSAEPGDRVVLMPGRYVGTTHISKSGAPEKPITIISESANESEYAVIDGGYPEGWDEYYLKPGMPEKSSKNHGFVVSNASWIEIENLVLRNCYNIGFKLENANYVVIRGCRIYGAGNAIHVNGAGTHHILVESNQWSCMPNDALFEQLQWKHGKSGQYRYLAQGSLFFVAQTGGGGSVIRYNRTRNTFNSLQMWPGGGIQHGDNLEIYGNHFGRSLDNCYEPERYAFNQHFYHNVLVGYKGCMVVSIQNVAGGPLFLYGNIAYSGRLIWKMNYQIQPPYFTDVFHCYHNTFDNGEGVNHDRSFKHWHHYNNIYDMRMGMRNWPSSMMSQTDNLFDYDCSNARWPDVIKNDGQEEHGLENTDPQFVNKSGRDYRLKPSSPCIDRGKVIPGFTQSYEGRAPDIGAYEGDHLVEGPPFQTLVPPGGLMYEERPRITRHRTKGRELRLFFSWPIKPETMRKEAVRLTADGAPAIVGGVQMGQTDREVIIKVRQSLEGKKLTLLLDPLPVGENGVTATHWASTIDTPR